MIDELDDAMIGLALADHQEEDICAIAIRCRDEVERVFRQGQVVSSEIESFTARLASIFSNS